MSEPDQLIAEIALPPEVLQASEAMLTVDHQRQLFGGHTMAGVGLSNRMSWWALMILRLIFCCIMMIVGAGGYAIELSPYFAAPGPSVISLSFFLLAICSALASFGFENYVLPSVAVALHHFGLAILLFYFIGDLVLAGVRTTIQKLDEWYISPLLILLVDWAFLPSREYFRWTYFIISFGVLLITLPYGIG